MKLGPVTKLDKRNKTTYKTIDIMWENFDFIVIFTILSIRSTQETGFQMPSL